MTASVAPPDPEEFRAAQNLLIGVAGQVITLLAPLPVVWPPGTKFNRETGEPLDPWTQPLSSGWVGASASAAVAYRALNRRFDWEPDALGPHQGQVTAIIIDRDDYDRFGSAATHAVVNDDQWEIHRWVGDGMRGIQRYIAPVDPRA